MTVIRCHVCQSDPIGRRKEPRVCIFIDPHEGGGRRYFCRDHLSERREAEIEAREKDRGWPPGGLR